MARDYFIRLAHVVPPFRIGDAVYDCYDKACLDASRMADENIGHTFHVYDSKHERPVYTRKKTYADDDPVWSAEPDIEDCQMLWASVIEMAQRDSEREAGGGRALLEKREARDFLNSIRGRE